MNANLSRFVVLLTVSVTSVGALAVAPFENVALADGAAPPANPSASPAPSAAPAPSPAPAPAAKPTASDCVSILRTETASGVDMAVNNSCARDLSCELRWTVQCETAEGKVTTRAPASARFAIAASAASQQSASAAACKDSWSVTDITWGCAAR